MSGPGSSPSEVAARDDAHLRSLGIKPELKRSLGFLSNFAVAFSYISVSTGTFTLIALGLGVEGSRAMVDKYVTPVEWHRPMPAALSEALLARA